MSKMSKLVTSYLDSLERSIRLREEMIQLLRITDRKHSFDKTGRNIALRQLQRDHHRVFLADKLQSRQMSSSASRNELLGEADEILDKRPNPDHLSRPPIDMRTLEQEKMYVALRVRWRELIKEAKIRALPSGPQR